MIITGQLLYTCLCRATPRVTSRTWQELKDWERDIYDDMANILMDSVREA